MPIQTICGSFVIARSQPWPAAGAASQARETARSPHDPRWPALSFAEKLRFSRVLSFFILSRFFTSVFGPFSDVFCIILFRLFLISDTLRYRFVGERSSSLNFMQFLK